VASIRSSLNSSAPLFQGFLFLEKQGASFTFTPEKGTIILPLRLRWFEVRVLTRILEHTSENVTRNWRKLHNVELNNIQSYPNIIKITKSRTMEKTWHVA
jgi:hypothetical protein